MIMVIMMVMLTTDAFMKQGQYQITKLIIVIIVIIRIIITSLTAIENLLTKIRIDVLSAREVN